jgi:hypothetical protein
MLKRLEAWQRFLQKSQVSHNVYSACVLYGSALKNYTIFKNKLKQIELSGMLATVHFRIFLSGGLPSEHMDFKTY